MATQGCACLGTTCTETCPARVQAVTGASTERAKLQLITTMKRNVFLLENDVLLETELSVARACAD